MSFELKESIKTQKSKRMKFFLQQKAYHVFNAIGDVRDALGTQQYIASDEIPL